MPCPGAASLPSPKCSREMCTFALIDDCDVIECILRHLGLWEQALPAVSARALLEPTYMVTINMVVM